MLNRRQAVQTAFTGAVAAIRQGTLSAQAAFTAEMWVNPAAGADANSGAKTAPLRTLAEAARRVNQSTGEGAATIILTAGIHAIGETTLLKPARRSFSRTGRLTIRAEVLPDEPE